MKNLRLVCLCLVLMALAKPSRALQAGPPALPCSLRGTVQLNGTNVPVGTVVTVGSAGLVYQTTTTTMYEGFSAYSLVVQADNPDTEAREGSAEGEMLEFTVGGLRAAETARWSSGAVLTLNLTASGPTPIPSATPNISATPRPSLTPSNTPPPSPTPSPTEPREQAVLYPLSDTHISSWYPSNNYDSSQYVTVRQGDIVATLLRFDVADLAGREVRSARLELYAIKRSNSAALTISAYRVLRPWVGKQATWAKASTEVAWDLAGCNGEGIDREATPSSTLLADAIDKWYGFDVTNMVRAWVADDAQNQGLVLKGAGGTSVEYNLASKESPDATIRPRLVVEMALGPAATATAQPTQTATQAVTQTPPTTLAPTASATPTSTITPPATGQPSPTPSPAQSAEELVLYPASDTYINSWYPSTNYDAAQYINVRQGDVMAALLRFDAAALAGREVRSAKLELYAAKRSNTAALTVSAYRVLGPWVGKQATWNQASTGVAWGSPGCNGEGTDRDAAVYSAVAVEAIGSWYRLDVTDMARAWAADADQNQGLVLKGSGGASVEYGFASNESADVIIRPRLIVQSVVGPVATPTVTPEQATPKPTDTVWPADTATSPAPSTPTATPQHTPSLTPSPVATSEESVFYAASDTYINSWYPSTNYGAAQYINVRQGDVMAALLRFDVAALAGREVRSAKLELYAAKRSNTAALTVSAYRVLGPWVGKQATWNQASTGVAWGSPGCNGEGTDRDAAVYSAVAVEAIGSWYRLDVTDMARAWAADADQNQGLVLKGSGGVSVEYGFASNESADVTIRPRLIVQSVVGPGPADVAAAKGP